MDGDTTFRSQPGHGSTFSIDLPLQVPTVCDVEHRGASPVASADSTIAESMLKSDPAAVTAQDGIV